MEEINQLFRWVEKIVTKLSKFTTAILKIVETRLTTGFRFRVASYNSDLLVG